MEHRPTERQTEGHTERKATPPSDQWRMQRGAGGHAPLQAHVRLSQ